jgi:hypothetical protein
VALPENKVIDFLTDGVENGRGGIRVFGRPVALHHAPVAGKGGVDLGQKIEGHDVVGVENHGHIVAVAELGQGRVEGLGFRGRLKPDLHRAHVQFAQPRQRVGPERIGNHHDLEAVGRVPLLTSLPGRIDDDGVFLVGRQQHRHPPEASAPDRNARQRFPPQPRHGKHEEIERHERKKSEEEVKEDHGGGRGSE